MKLKSKDINNSLEKIKELIFSNISKNKWILTESHQNRHNYQNDLSSCDKVDANNTPRSLSKVINLNNSTQISLTDIHYRPTIYIDREIIDELYQTVYSKLDTISKVVFIKCFTTDEHSFQYRHRIKDLSNDDFWLHIGNRNTFYKSSKNKYEFTDLLEYIKEKPLESNEQIEQFIGFIKNYSQFTKKTEYKTIISQIFKEKVKSDQGDIISKKLGYNPFLSGTESDIAETGAQITLVKINKEPYFMRISESNGNNVNHRLYENILELVVNQLSEKKTMDRIGINSIDYIPMYAKTKEAKIFIESKDSGLKINPTDMINFILEEGIPAIVSNPTSCKEIINTTIEAFVLQKELENNEVCNSKNKQKMKI